MNSGDEATVLWRPTRPEELDLIRESGWRKWPPLSPDRPWFYPFLDEDSAILISRNWRYDRPDQGVSYVTRFQVEQAFLSHYSTRTFGGSTTPMLWVPSEDLDEFNSHIVGPIEVVHEFR
ncbi:hypothetical protein OG792_02870 [Micromonospora sp. NBC_01699]|uniref:hypothetical protein n=1 Tax=Micromonospora sp. NBC_01699 TaxID=2975984 RepID=UPI002E2B4010|nr:hypothetical protein [Micromonospora sp. NBC_01699]